ncbi:MAG TPA: type II toxin-antitoxin system VapC family toxin, partial [Polyangiaceae bacterium]
IAIKLVVAETDSDLARRLWQSWAELGELRAAPALFRAETFSTLRRKVHQHYLDAEQGESAYRFLESLDIEIREPDSLYSVAWQYANEFNRPTVYDCCYLALAAILGCELWTADRRLVNSVRPRLTWVRTLGD